MALWIAGGAWLAVAALLVWFLRASRRHSDRMRVSEPPKPDSRDSIARFRREVSDGR